ncbi:hypothetical protein BDZ91DRAFT_835518 [Kalaharituber pfeilii]|nr:hypothetical protein BDZ91DRAFT_835518 [Kalaharituber pfeilii]
MVVADLSSQVRRWNGVDARRDSEGGRSEPGGRRIGVINRGDVWDSGEEKIEFGCNGNRRVSTACSQCSAIVLGTLTIPGHPEYKGCDASNQALLLSACESGQVFGITFRRKSGTIQRRRNIIINMTISGYFWYKTNTPYDHKYDYKQRPSYTFAFA